MFAPFYRPQRFPFIPMGGPFMVIMGVMVMLGSAMPDRRNDLVNLGFVIGGISFAFSWRLARGLPSATRWQVASLVLAIVLEVAVMVHFTPALQALGERNFLISVLAIVGAHFVIMAPAYGRAALVLAVLCCGNAALGYALPREDIDVIWLLDGMIKAAVGVTMVLASPLLAPPLRP